MSRRIVILETLNSCARLSYVSCLLRHNTSNRHWRRSDRLMPPPPFRCSLPPMVNGKVFAPRTHKKSSCRNFCVNDIYSFVTSKNPKMVRFKFRFPRAERGEHTVAKQSLIFFLFFWENLLLETSMGKFHWDNSTAFGKIPLILIGNPAENSREKNKAQTTTKSFALFGKYRANGKAVCGILRFQSA